MCPIELAQAIAEGLQLFEEYAAYRAEQGMPPSTLMVWPFVAAVAPEHLLPAVLRWMDEALTPSPTN